MTEPMTPQRVDLAPIVLRLADHLAAVQQRPQWDGGPAPIDARLLLHAIVDVPAGSDYAVFADRLREMRREGTRQLLGPVDDALRAVLAKHLGGEIGLNFGTGDLYTAEQVRSVAHVLTGAGEGRG